VLVLKKKIVEQCNYSRRNNILIQNIPEGVEDADCKEFVKCVMEGQLDTSIDIKDVHRNPDRPPRVGAKS